MRTDHVKLRIDGPVAVFVLDRPAKLNALTLGMLDDIAGAAADVAASDAKALVVAGAGRAFSAGIDIETFRSGALFGADPDRRYDAATMGRTAAEALASTPQVSIAALHGNVVGGAAVLAAACDLRVAERDTTFAVPEIDLGIPLAWGGIERLVGLIGPARTKDIVLTGRTFGTEEAADIGLVDRVVDRGEAFEAAIELAGVIASKARLAVRITKRHVDEVVAGDTSRDDALGLLAAIEDDEASDIRSRFLDAFRPSS